MRKILTIDGGGIKGVFPAAFLACIENKIGESVTDYFDLIVGTSTGGIIALGLGLGLSMETIESIYVQDGPDIFSGNRIFLWARRLGLSKYDVVPLKNILSKHFENKKLGNSKVRLVIPSFNLENGEVHVFKTAHHERFQTDYKESAVDVALATAAAPTYFPTHRNLGGVPLVDGGIWANNPVLFGVIEAFGVLGWNPQEVKVLSIGCTHSSLDVQYGRTYGLGLTYWASRIADLFMAGQSSSALGGAQLLIGKENLWRVSPYVPPKRFSLDSISGIESLKGLGYSEARKISSEIQREFFAKKAECFLPIHKL